MFHCSLESNSAGKQLKKTKKLEVATTPQNHVLHHSNRHNLQTSISGRGLSFAKGRSTLKKTDAICPLKQVVDIDAKQPAGCLSRCTEDHPQLASASKAAVEVQDPTQSSEIIELKWRLQTANLQIAEVVAQSAILVRDMEYAASKKIADTLRHAQGGEPKRSSSALNTQIEWGNHVSVGTLEQELAVTRQELADCKCMLAAMRRQLDQTSREKEKLETYLRSSMETSLKLERTLANQKAVMQLELLAAEERCRNDYSGSVQSVRNEAKHLQQQLDAAMLSKAESDGLLRDCIQWLCHAQRQLLQVKVPKNGQCCFQSAVREKYRQLQIAQEQVQIQRDSLYETSAENAIIWTVLECIWEGAIHSSLERRIFSPRKNVHVETPELSWPNSRQLWSSHVQKSFYSSEEDPTPLKSSNFLASPRATNVTGDEHRGPKCESSPSEEVLRQSLLKSEQEVGILGEKVDELRVILEKVTLLLECISKSSVTGHETRVVMRRIIEQLQTFEM